MILIYIFYTTPYSIYYYIYTTDALDYPTCTTTNTNTDTIYSTTIHTHTTPLLPQLSAQTSIFLQMYTRIKKSDSYKQYKHYTSQQHTNTNHNMYNKYALYTIDINSNNDNIYDTDSNEYIKSKARHSSSLLSEESDFQYDACTQAYTVGKKLQFLHTLLYFFL